MMTSNETRLTVEIDDLIISEGLSFNLSQKYRFKKVLQLARTVSKCYQPPNRKLLSKDLLEVIHDQNMERNLSLIEKESEIFGLLFLGDGATISRVPLLKLLVSGKSFQWQYQNLLIGKATQQMVGQRMQALYIIYSLITLKESILTSQ